jgi:hypothetical protein
MGSLSHRHLSKAVTSEKNSPLSLLKGPATFPEAMLAGQHTIVGLFWPAPHNIPPSLQRYRILRPAHQIGSDAV